MSNSELAILFSLQLAIILGVCRVVGFLAQKIGQPQVVGEMIAGVLLGPSLFGLLWPGLQHQVFPNGAPSEHSVRFQSDRLGALYVFDWCRI